MRWLIVTFLLIFSHLNFSSDYLHRLHVHVNLAKSYVTPLGNTVIPVSGTQNVLIQVVDVELDQPLWSMTKDMYIRNGEISVLISDASLDWTTLLLERQLVFRVTMIDDIIDIPFENLPYSLLADFSDRARYFTNSTIAHVDYVKKRFIVNSATSNAEFAVNGVIRANHIVGDGSGLINLTGPGFNDTHSLNSQNGFFKDVLFVDSTGNVGIHTKQPKARLHIKGNTVFQGSPDRLQSSYISPTGSVLLWDSSRSAFRSGKFNKSFVSNDVGLYSIAFGEDVLSKAKYSSILGGETHLINNNAISSVIVGGQDHSILDSYSVIVGGYKNLISGEWSVVFGGREHNVYGDYNVLLGGKKNEIRGKLNTIIGKENFVFSDFSIVLGEDHRVSSNQSTALGQKTLVSHPFSIVYSDGESRVTSTRPKQMVIQAKNGLGLNMAPHPDHMLSVNGNIKATNFVGDGRFITNIIAGQDFWRQVPGNQNAGIYYMHGPVSIGTIQSKATLTVGGGITVGPSLQASNGTLQFTENDGLQFYHNGWISVDQEDTDTKLLPGDGIALTGQTFSIDQLGADKNQSLYYNGSRWAPRTTRLWTSYDNGIYLNRKLALTDDSPLTRLKAPLVIEEPTGGSDFTYPLVIGQTDSLRFHPNRNVILLNLDYIASENAYRMINSSYLDREVNSYGSLIMIDNQKLKFKHTIKPYKKMEQVQFDPLFTITPTSMVILGDEPQVGFDSKGSISFLNTYADNKKQVGVGFKGHVLNTHPQYLFFDSLNHLNIFAGNDTTSQPINFKSNSNTVMSFNSNRELIVGGTIARAKLSILGGGLVLNRQGGGIGGASYSGNRTYVNSFTQTANPGHRLMFKRNNAVLADLKYDSSAIGTSNLNQTTLLGYSESAPEVLLKSTSKAQLSFYDKPNIGFDFENNDGVFSIKNKTQGSEQTMLSLDDSNHLSLFSSTRSSRPTTEVVINGDIEISNKGHLNLYDSNQIPITSFYKNNNSLVLKQMNAQPIRFQSQTGSDILVVSANRQMAINSLQVSNNAQLYVVGDTLFKAPIYYTHNGANRLVQSFVIDKSSTTAADNFEVRSVKSLRVDEESGVRLTVNDQDTITIAAPGYYRRLYETKLYDGFDLDPQTPPAFIEANGKDILALKEILPNGGVSINLLDTNGDGTNDSVQLYNVLLDGGFIEGTITVNGNVLLGGTNADGSKVSNIPFKWKLNRNHLYYTSGNVGINTNSPDFPLDVNSTMVTATLNISTRLDMRKLDFENSTSTTVNNQILFSVDTKNTATNDRIQFDSVSGNLLTLLGQSGLNQQVGIFTPTPDADIHLKQNGKPSSVLLQSLAAGQPKFHLFNSALSKGAVIQLNKSTQMPHYGSKLNEFVFAATQNIKVFTSGSEALHIHDGSISIFRDRKKTTFYVDGTATVGDQFAGSLSHPNHGLTVQEKMSVGHLTSISTGATFYSKDTLRVGTGLEPPTQFKGTIVQNRVGVGITQPEEALAIFGGAKIKNNLSIYNSSKLKLFEFTPTTFRIFPSHYSLFKRYSKEYNLSIANQRVMTAFNNSITFGNDTIKDSSNFYLYNVSTDAKILLEDTSASHFPYIHFSLNSNTHKARIGIAQDGTSTKTLIESNGSDFSNPDMVIRQSKVGIGKSPSYALDVNGEIKSNRLYKQHSDSNKAVFDRMYPVPLGSIVMWTGSTTSIPAGWQLCDGTNNSPDLSNKFIKGTDAAGIDSLAIKTGGKSQDTVTSGDHTHIGGTHTHTVQGGSHNHGINVNNKWFSSQLNGSTPTAWAYNYGKRDGGTQITQPINHGHTFNSNHNHSSKSQSNGMSSDGSAHHKQHANTNGGHTHNGGAHTHNWTNGPSYYVVAFIIKISDT